ncbi:glutathione S-transferase family protein [Geminicoccus roseus]|uniref:glutathione S-transferase family protein n=1 Tax=Geminicoccus roseus TaxID=404900 RepID=UPI000416DD3B|nr:glutathione S-transferase family protein [Geminicoccus roseus]
MQPILFYGVPEGCSFGSIVALEWLGIPYRLCRIAMPEVVQSEAYRRINPVGETPALLTGSGAVLTESMAILNHLGSQGIAQGLAFAQGSSGFDRLNAMLAFLNTSFFNAFSPLWHTLEHPGEGNAALVAYGRSLVAKAHAELEAMLDGKDWLLGDRPTLADAYFAGIARWTDVHPVVDRRTYPCLQRLFQRLQDDPAVRFAYAVEHEQSARSAGGFVGHVDLTDVLRLPPA